MNNVGAAVSILVIEDEVVTGLFLRAELEAAGFNVELAESGAQARRRFATAASFGAAIVDLGLPDECGDRLARDLRALRPDLPMIIATGESESVIGQAFAHDEKLCVLLKPYDGHELARGLAALNVVS